MFGRYSDICLTTEDFNLSALFWKGEYCITITANVGANTNRLYLKSILLQFCFLTFYN